MKDSLIVLVVFAAFFAILYAVSYFPAKWMVKKTDSSCQKTLNWARET